MIKDCQTPHEACKVLAEESTRRWREEEEVVDDISVLLVYF
jgi:hypothetical protein